MISRTYGWVQNPSDFSKLKLVVQIFDSNSKHYDELKNSLVKKYIFFEEIRENLLSKLRENIEKFTYLELVGTSKDRNGKSPRKRENAVPDSLIQISILPQSANTKQKYWTDNWTADGFLRWALSLNFIKHNRDTDICSITDLGKLYSESIDDSDDEKKILRIALLSYPPATQVLSILNSCSPEAVTKFRIGNKLGFTGENGFTSYDEQLMFDWFKVGSTEEQKKLRNDVEGTSDKYARMIASWLHKVGYVEKHQTKVVVNNGEQTGFQKFTITGAGIHALKQANGSSKNSRIVKFLTWEFLAVKGKNRDYIRSRRAYILKFLEETKSFSKLVEKLEKIGFKDDIAIIKNDIIGLNNFGIRIDLNDNTIVLRDSIVNFSIPELNLTQELKDEAAERLKAKFMNETGLAAKYIELLEIAFDGTRNRDFEIVTADLFKNVYGFNSVLLGGGRKPDALIYTDSFGVIIDTKAYKEGYSKSISQEDEMVRYIEDNQFRDNIRNSTEWWKNFSDTIDSDSFYFLWVSSKFIGQFSQQLMSTSNRTNISGAALNVQQLLIGAAAARDGLLDISTFPNYMTNSEISWG